MREFNSCAFNKDGKPDFNKLLEEGAIVPVEIGLPSQTIQVLIDKSRLVPKPVEGIALIDTGASNTCAHEPLLSQNLKLKPVDEAILITPSGESTNSVYGIQLRIPCMNNWSINVTRAMGVNLPYQTAGTEPQKPIIALIGRDILKKWLLTFNGRQGFWTVQW